MTLPMSSEAEEDHFRHQLTQAQDRLVAYYAGRDGVSADNVRQTFDAVTRRYTDARVRAFVPILVERGVRRELGR